MICRTGTADRKIVVRGVPNAQGALPVVDGRDATTRSVLNYWNEKRGVIKVGGANVPADTMPRHIVIENLEIRSGRPPYTFSGRDGLTAYAKNSAAIFVEKGEHITVRNCVLRDCGNGLFCASQSSDVLVEGCHIFDNGIEGRIYEHNNYTEARGIVFQYNHFGALREGCLGNNLKDRSAGTVIRYNWIENGNRQLDLVDSDHSELIQDPAYRSTFVYGNVLVEADGEGNNQICHYGGDSGDLSRYRKGTLYFYNNTVVSTRSGSTTLLRLSSEEETCDLRNNILYVTAPGERLALMNAAGRLLLRNNWIKAGWVKAHGFLTGEVQDLGGNLTGDHPGVQDVGAQRFGPTDDSPCVDGGTDLAPGGVANPVSREYVPHRQGRPRLKRGNPDIGAYEYVPVQTDFDGSGRVDFADFIMFASAFGRRSQDVNWDARYDLDGNAEIGFSDFVLFVQTFGREASGVSVESHRILRLYDERIEVCFGSRIGDAKDWGFVF